MPRRLLLVLAALFIAAFAGLMLTKTLPYYTFEKGIHFLTTKNDDTNDNPMFRAGFYVHITISLLVLMAGLLQFLPGLARRRPGLHRRLGKFFSRRNHTTRQVKTFVVPDNVFAAAPEVCKDFGIGDRSREINPKYAKPGWSELWENEEWWADSPKPKLSL